MARDNVVLLFGILVTLGSVLVTVFAFVYLFNHVL